METVMDTAGATEADPCLATAGATGAADWFSKRTYQHLMDSALVTVAAASHCQEAIMQAAGIIADTLRAGGKLLLCGNGGSAADCQHLATEFVSRLTKDFERPALAAIALTTDTSFLTAYANDCGFAGIFQRQVEALGRPGDVLLGVSTSGNSNNVVLAVEAANSRGMKTISMCGEGGILAGMTSCNIAVPSSYTPHIQETHLAIEHVLCDVVERLLFGRQAARSNEGPAVHEEIEP